MTRRASLAWAFPLFAVVAAIAGCSGGAATTDAGGDAPPGADASSETASADATTETGGSEAGADATEGGIDAAGDAADAAVDATDAAGDAADAAGDAARDAVAEAAARCVGQPAASRRTLFLNFDGATLTPGFSDATTNKTPLIAKTTVIAAFAGPAGQRAATIAEIVGIVTDALAPFDLAIVTTRPAAGPYDMIVFGGTSAVLELPGIGPTSVAPIDCGDGRKSDLAVVFDGMVALRLANEALSTVGSMVGMDAVTRPGDCLGDGRVAATTVCTYGANAPKDQSLALCGTAPQDEPALLATAYGCRP